MTARRLMALSFALAVAAAVGGSQSPAARPDDHAAAMPARATPLDQAHLYVCGFHFYNGQVGRGVEAHHYCIVDGGDVAQCVIFDGNGRDAKLIGIEYIVGEDVFAKLSDEEKALWHSHDYEVKSGALIAPGMPEKDEHALMAKLINTYGKTVHTWQVDRGDKVPLGIPQVMMGYTADGQLDPKLVADRDRRLKVSTEALRKARADIPEPKLVPGVNAWMQGKVTQLELKVTTPAAK